MAIFVDASARKETTSPGYRVEVRVQYTNQTGAAAQVSPRRAIFELLDSADLPIQRYSPNAVPDDAVPDSVQIPPRGCFRFEVSFTTDANLRESKCSLRSSVANESAYSLVQIRPTIGTSGKRWAFPLLLKRAQLLQSRKENGDGTLIGKSMKTKLEETLGAIRSSIARPLDASLVILTLSGVLLFVLSEPDVMDLQDSPETTAEKFSLSASPPPRESARPKESDEGSRAGQNPAGVAGR